MAQRPANLVVDRAMRAAFEAWKKEMLRSGKVRGVIDAEFDDIAERDRRLIELQCRAAIASLKEEVSIDAMHDKYRCDEEWKDLDSRKVLGLWIDAALKP